MICPHCGAQVNDGSTFCPSCGAAVHRAAPAVSSGARGCFGSAWDDVRGSKGWAGKVALMALIDLVPILNFVNIGYGYRWGADIANGKAEPLPKKIVSGLNFGTGFNILVIAFVAGIVVMIESALLAIVPVLGWIALPVLIVFIQMFLNLAYIRTALLERLGAGFEVGKIMDGYKRKLDTLFCITFVPGLVAGLIAIAIMMVAALAIGAVAGIDSAITASNLSSALGAAARYNAYNPGYLIGFYIGSAGIVGIVLALVALYAIAAAERFCILVTQRAAGHYVARFVPEWAGERQAPVGAFSAAAPAAATVPAAQGQQAPPPSTSSAPAANTASAQAAPAAAPVRQAAAVAFETAVLVEPESYDTVVQPEAREQAAASASVAAPLPNGSDSSTAVRTMGASVSVDDSGTTVLVDGKPEARLTITRSNGESCTLASFPTVIGKGTEADLRIEGNSAISRTHVRILRDGNLFAAEDLGATNKTFIGSYELAPHTPTMLSDGDDLVLGNEVLHVTIA